MTRRIDPGLIPKKPDLGFENALWNAGCRIIAGVDEAGRGSLAGPVMAALVVLPIQAGDSFFSLGIQDSKQLSNSERSQFRKYIEKESLAWGVGSASNNEIDQIGIIPATRLAVQRALSLLTLQPDHLLVDYIVLPDIPIAQTRLVKGDARSLSIACASILAKTHRDQYMISISEKYPSYGFDQNKGYGTVQHKTTINESGPSPIHRMSFSPLKQLNRKQHHEL